MTITLPEEVEVRLQERARIENLEPNVLASRLIDEKLTFDANEYRETVEGVERGMKAFEEGRTLTLEEFSSRARARAQKRG